ncbi:hypothetical protein VNI00_009041 [Paramarasmius palmivorus]|uniref:F-box domain-containing protein n=1 Tax=Paramarasmius palmivorus TaxID=297713 RepID=A0AAW0CRX0_9AGAR
MFSEQVPLLNIHQSTPRRTTLCDKCHNTFVSHTPHPPVPTELLKSCGVPTNIQISETLSFIADEEREIDRYDVEILKLRHAMDCLESEKAEMREKIRDRKGWISALRRIPPEILSQVLQEWSDMDEYDLEVRTQEISAHTLRMSHVSSQWRNVIISLPRLWSRFAVSMEDTIKFRNADDLINLHLERAGSHPLLLHLIVKTKAPPEELFESRLGPHGDSILRTMARALPRCKELYLGVEDEFLLLLEKGLQGSSFPMLESFSDEFTDGHRPWSSSDNQVVSSFCAHLHNAPRLRRLFLASDYLIRTVMLPYGQLTRIHLITLSLTVAKHILQVCTSLSALTVEGLCDPVAPLPVPAVLQNLTYLDFRGCNTDCLTALFQSVTLPSATYLSIDAHLPPHSDFGRTVAWHSETEFISMLERSAAPLQEVHLFFNDVYMTSDRLAKLLPLCPQLTSLEVSVSTRPEDNMEQWAMVPQLLQQLVAEGSSHELSLAPRLAQIDLSERVVLESTALSIAELALRMAESRRLGSDGMQVLKKVRVECVLQSGDKGQTSHMLKDECLVLGTKGLECELILKLEQSAAEEVWELDADEEPLIY